ATIARDHRIEHVAPAVCAVHVARSERAPFEIAVLVEHEERMVAGAGEVAVVRRALLRAVRRAHAAVDVEHQRRPGTSSLCAIDPVPREIGQRHQIRRRCHRTGLEATHLARGRGLLRHRTAADDPAHRRIAPEAVGIVHVVVAGEAPEHGLAKLGDQAVAPVPPGAGVGEHLSRHRREAEGRSSSRKASSPASEVTVAPWNSSFSRRSNVTRSPLPSASPVASSIRRPLDGHETLAVHSRFARHRHRATGSSGKSGLRRGTLALTTFAGPEQLLPVEEREVPAVIDFDFANRVPYPGEWRSDFSLRWNGYLWAETPGAYRIEATFDDGCRVFLDDHVVFTD